MADQETTTPETPSPGGLGQIVQGKAVLPSKGSKLVLPVQPTTGVMPSSILEDMERLYQQKVASQNPFQEWMKDILAWGGTALPGTTGETLQKRAAEKEGRDVELFNMRAQIAAARAQQAQQAQEAERFWGIAAPQAAAPQAAAPQAAAPQAAAPQAAAPQAAAPQAAAQGVQQANQATGGLLGLVQDPALRMQIGAQFMTDRTKAMNQLNQYLTKRAEEPTIKKEIDYLVNVQGMDPKQALPIAIAKVAGTGAFIPHEVRGPSGTMQQTPIQAAAKLSAPPTTPAPMPQRQPSVQVPIQTSPTATAPAAPAATPAVSSTGFAPGSKEDLSVRQSIQEGAGKGIVARQESLITQGQKADANIRQYDTLIEKLKETPNAVGIAQRPGTSSSVIALTKDGGVTLPILGTLRAPELEEAVARKTLSSKELENRNIIGTLAQRSALEYRREVYDKTGQVSDSETRIAELANGLSTSSPFRANLMFAVLHKERQQLNKDRYEGWLKFQEKHPSATFDQYEKTDYYRKTSIEDMDKRLMATFPGAFKSPGEMKPLSSFRTKEATR